MRTTKFLLSQKPIRWVIGFFALFSITVLFATQGAQSAWVRMTLPFTFEMSGNSLLGYNGLLSNRPFMHENWATVIQVLYFQGINGLEPVLNFYIYRPLYPFLAGLLTPILGVISSFMVLNGCLWACSVWLTLLLGWKITRDGYAAALAGLLATIGSGMVFHVNDYSPHMLSFLTMYAGIYFIHRSGIWCASRASRTHLFLGAFLAVSLLAYTSAYSLLAIYVCVSWPRNNRWTLATVACLVLLVRPIWKLILHSQGVNFPDVESDYFDRALHAWVTLLAHPSWDGIFNAARSGSEFWSWDFPLLTAAGLFACFRMPKSGGEKWFGFLVLTFIMLPSYFFSPTATARGYLVFGMSIWLYSWTAAWFCDCWRQQRRFPYWILGLCAFLMLGLQIVWVLCELYSWPGAIVSYFLGWRIAFPLFFSPGPRVLSMTGLEGLLPFYNWSGSMESAGAWMRPLYIGLSAELYSWSHKLIRCVFIVTVLGGLAAASTPWVRGRRNRVLYTLILLSIMGWSLRFRPIDLLPNYAQPPFFIPSTSSLHYRASLSNGFVRRLTTDVPPDAKLCVFVHVDGAPGIRASIGNQSLITMTPGSDFAPSERMLCIPASRLAAGLDQFESVNLDVEIENQSTRPIKVNGWQRDSLQARSVWIERGAQKVSWSGPYLPSVEVRLYSHDGRLVIAGY